MPISLSRSADARHFSAEALERAALEVRKSLLSMWRRHGGGHLGGALSAVEILVALYFSVMEGIAVGAPKGTGDRFILSKAHSAMGLYAVLGARGLIGLSDLAAFGANGSPFEIHLSAEVPGVMNAGGALGQGLSLGIGMALAAKVRGEAHSIFVLMGDGEMNEGQVWEAAMAAAHFGARNLIGIVDRNGFQQDGAAADVMDTAPLAAKWAAFGWQALCVNDGHSLPDLCHALHDAKKMAREGRPVIVIANTVKGRSLPTLEGTADCHYLKTADPEEYQLAMYELERMLRGYSK